MNLAGLNAGLCNVWRLLWTRYFVVLIGFTDQNCQYRQPLPNRPTLTGRPKLEIDCELLRNKSEVHIERWIFSCSPIRNSGL